MFGSDKLFCEISPTTYKISKNKEILKRHIKNIKSKENYCKDRNTDPLEYLLYEHHSYMIKKGKGIDPMTQYNKAENIALASSKINGLIIHPGESFSFWHFVGKVTKSNGFKEGRIIINNKLTVGLGGGLCNLANTLHLLVLHSPLTVTEFHNHSDALAMESGPRNPLSSGTAVDYNYIDYRFKNNTDQDFQLLFWVENETSYAEIRSNRDISTYYEIVEENHHFHKENEKYYRISKIYRETYDKDTNALLKKELLLDNHSEVMFDYSLIPSELIK